MTNIYIVSKKKLDIGKYDAIQKVMESSIDLNKRYIVTSSIKNSMESNTINIFDLKKKIKLKNSG